MDDSIAVSRAARGLSTYRALVSWCVSFAWIALLAFVAYAIANLPGKASSQAGNRNERELRLVAGVEKQVRPPVHAGGPNFNSDVILDQL